MANLRRTLSRLSNFLFRRRRAGDCWVSHVKRGSNYICHRLKSSSRELNIALVCSRAWNRTVSPDIDHLSSDSAILLPSPSPMYLVTLRPGPSPVPVPEITVVIDHCDYCRQWERSPTGLQLRGVFPIRFWFLLDPRERPDCCPSILEGVAKSTHSYALYYSFIVAHWATIIATPVRASFPHQLASQCFGSSSGSPFSFPSDSLRCFEYILSMYYADVLRRLLMPRLSIREWSRDGLFVRSLLVTFLGERFNEICTVVPFRAGKLVAYTRSSLVVAAEMSQKWRDPNRARMARYTSLVNIYLLSPLTRRSWIAYRLPVSPEAAPSRAPSEWTFPVEEQREKRQTTVDATSSYRRLGPIFSGWIRKCEDRTRLHIRTTTQEPARYPFDVESSSSFISSDFSVLVRTIPRARVQRVQHERFILLEAYLVI
jgi:hypothetical protein